MSRHNFSNSDGRTGADSSSSGSAYHQFNQNGERSAGIISRPENIPLYQKATQSEVRPFRDPGFEQWVKLRNTEGEDTNPGKPYIDSPYYQKSEDELLDLVTGVLTRRVSPSEFSHSQVAQRVAGICGYDISNYSCDEYRKMLTAWWVALHRSACERTREGERQYPQQHQDQDQHQNGRQLDFSNEDSDNESVQTFHTARSRP